MDDRAKTRILIVLSLSLRRLYSPSLMWIFIGIRKQQLHNLEGNQCKDAIREDEAADYQ